MNYYVLCLVCWILLGITGKISISTSPVTYVSGVRSLDQSIFRSFEIPAGKCVRARCVRQRGSWTMKSAADHRESRRVSPLRPRILGSSLCGA